MIDNLALLAAHVMLGMLLWKILVWEEKQREDRFKRTLKSQKRHVKGFRKKRG